MHTHKHTQTHTHTHTQAKDWEGLTQLLEQKDFANMEDNLLKLVNGPVLNADDKKSIGTRKRYGIAADVRDFFSSSSGIVASPLMCVPIDRFVPIDR
jgi:hypothetical protein